MKVQKWRIVTLKTIHLSFRFVCPTKYHIDHTAIQTINQGQFWAHTSCKLILACICVLSWIATMLTLLVVLKCVSHTLINFWGKTGFILYKNIWELSILSYKLKFDININVFLYWLFLYLSKCLLVQEQLVYLILFICTLKFLPVLHLLYCEGAQCSGYSYSVLAPLPPYDLYHLIRILSLLPSLWDCLPPAQRWIKKKKNLP